MSSVHLAVAYDDETLYERAKALALQLQLPLDNQVLQRLLVSTDKLALHIAPFLPLYADFTIQTWQSRHDAGRQQGLVRAVKPKTGLKILDATAGWGRDAAVLASFGAEVVLLERNPVMAALLADALSRQDARSREVMKISLLQVDAIDYLAKLTSETAPDVIYLDPMHPLRKKDALVKGALQVLQQLIGPDPDVAALLAVARQKALSRVVVKWPKSLPALEEPTYSIQGKTVRFDIYSDTAQGHKVKF
jgi:16S rRNA (guanine1516-N2)-methyltransferase